jgi:hypothetical protein
LTRDDVILPSPNYRNLTSKNKKNRPKFSEIVFFLTIVYVVMVNNDSRTLAVNMLVITNGQQILLTNMVLITILMNKRVLPV